MFKKIFTAFTKLFSVTDLPEVEDSPKTDEQSSKDLFNISEYPEERRVFFQVIEKISGFSLSKEDKENMCYEFVVALQSGDPRNTEKVCMKWLYKEKWDWLWFETWKKHFQKSGKYPYMWKSLKLNELCPEIPIDIVQALPLFTVPQLRSFLKNKAVKVSPAPKKREEVEAAVCKFCNLEDIKVELSEKLEELKNKHKETQKKAKIKLLEHTLMMSIYAINRKKSIQECSADMKMLGRKLKISTAGCPVETEIAQKEFEKGKWPPFFPGDRTGILWAKD